MSNTLSVIKIMVVISAFAALAACSATGVQTADFKLTDGAQGTAIRVGATGNTPGLTAVALPNGARNGYAVAAVGGNGYAGDLIGAVGTIVSGGLIGAGINGAGAPSATASSAANASAVAQSIYN